MSSVANHVPRVGFVIPAGNTTLEVEAPLVLGGVAASHFQRFTQLIKSQNDLELGAAAIVEAARTLVGARVAAIGVGYTAGSFAGGPAWDADLRVRISDATGRAATTAADAIVRVLHGHRFQRVAAVSPYAQEVNDNLRAYLAKEGIDTTSLVGSPPAGPAGEVPMPEVEALALSVDRSGAQALLISCTGLRTLALIDSLERKSGLPVVSSNQALFATLRVMVGIEASIPGYGSVLAEAVLPTA